MSPVNRMAYLDHAATAPLRSVARDAMLPWLGDRFGNPSGAHASARAARQAVDEARDVMAEALGCAPGEIVFTSGGTESDNAAVFGVHRRRGGTAVCSAVEHHAVLEPVHVVGGVIVGVDSRGVIDLDALAATLDAHPDVTVVSVMLANNEVGAIQPIAAVAEVVADRAPAATLHTDAVQAFPWLDVPERAAPAALVSISAHKFGGPQGVGVLVVREGTALAPLLVGGGQERDRRSGTHAVAAIVGMAAAARELRAARAQEAEAVRARRDRLAEGLRASIPDLVETAGGPDGDRSHLLPGTCHVCIDGVESESLLFLLDRAGVAASAASSCASGAMEPSHVLAAMGVSRSRAAGSLRFTLGPTTTDADVDRALEAVPAAAARLRRAR